MFEVESPSPALVSAATDFLEAWDLYLEADRQAAPVDDLEGPVDVEAWEAWYDRRRPFAPAVEVADRRLTALIPVAVSSWPELAEFARGVVGVAE